jgi:hypothetical protein
VVAGTDIVASWQILNADQVNLSINETPWGPVLAEGQISRSIGNTDETFTLVASNADNRDAPTTFETVLIEADEDRPDPPTRVRGSRSGSDPTKVEIEWDFDLNDQTKIEYFRIYRAEDQGRFVVVVNDLEPTDRSWTDEGVPADQCVAYYVVAVYLDFEDRLQETDASDTSWYDDACD